MTQDTATTAHVIMTRFNLPSNGFESYVRNTAHWLQTRVELFERYCLPSVQAQSDQDFTWIVYFDPHSPSWLTERIAAWQSYKRFNPVFRDEVSLAEKRHDIATHAGPSRARLITTNLDNDDGLARNFVARIKSTRPVARRCSIFFQHGLIFDGTHIFHHSDPGNAFCSVSEPWENPVTCWAHPHDELARHMPALALAGPPAWLQVIHGGNVSNRVKGHRVAPPPFQSQFLGIESAMAPSWVHRTREVLIETPSRTTHEFARATAKRVITLAFGRQGVDRAKILWRRVRL